MNPLIPTSSRQWNLFSHIQDGSTSPSWRGVAARAKAGSVNLARAFARDFLRLVQLRTSLLEKCRFEAKTLWIIAEIGVFLVWKNADQYVGKKNIALH